MDISTIDTSVPRLAQTANDWHGSLLLSKGRTYFERGQDGDYALALEEYQSALNLEEYPLKSRAWHAMGNVLFQDQRYAEAEEAFRNALVAGDSDNNRGIYLNSLGNVMVRQGQLSEAIVFYEDALTQQDLRRPDIVLNNLADALRLNGKFAEAVAHAQRVPPAAPEFQRAQLIKTLATRQLNGGKVLHEEADLVRAGQKLAWDSDNPETRIRASILGHATQYENYATKSPSRPDNCFSVLRGWSSSIPLLTGNDCRGGGYFLKWRGRGLVIDPGFDFLRNFHEAGFRSSEINAIVVSHSHPDHISDLYSVESLLYDIRKGTENTYLLALDSETAEPLLDTPLRERVTRADQGRKRTGRWTAFDEFGMSVDYFGVVHKTTKDDTALGFRMTFNLPDGGEFIVAYTGDTEYFDELPSRIGARCDLLLAHIGSTRAEEFMEPRKDKKDHLGYNGLIKLLRSVNPAATIVGEFWGGVGDLRIDTIKALRRKTGLEAILPAGIGLHVHIPSLLVECSSCSHPVPPERVTIASSTSPFGPLGYLCDHCMT